MSTQKGFESNGVQGKTGTFPTENCHCPRFIAYAAEDSYVDASDNLESLIDNILNDTTEEGIPIVEFKGEDIVIWDHTDRIAAVITSGKVTRFKSRAK